MQTIPPRVPMRIRPLIRHLPKVYESPLRSYPPSFLETRNRVSPDVIMHIKQIPVPPPPHLPFALAMRALVKKVEPLVPLQVGKGS